MYGYVLFEILLKYIIYTYDHFVSYSKLHTSENNKINWTILK